ncbi:hypothetical protein IWGMT90018_36670 [Mycobacterium kiyosense]|nr:hypothetical protein IWGMT90018_36670 [Mycobacterium kiyosense]
MASSSAPVHPARYLSVFLVMLIGVYLLVFLTGDKKPHPKLGIDLQGGTRVTLTARTPDGKRPSAESLAQAQQIISSRVNGLGVSGSEVVVDGDNLVITVPGNDGNEARNLGQTARLYIRPVLSSQPAQKAPPEEAQPAEQQPAPAAPAPGAPAPQPGRRNRVRRRLSRGAAGAAATVPAGSRPEPVAGAGSRARPGVQPGTATARRSARTARSAQGSGRAHRAGEEVAAEHQPVHPDDRAAIPGHPLRQRRHPGRKRRPESAPGHLLDRPQNRLPVGAVDHQR